MLDFFGLLLDPENLSVLYLHLLDLDAVESVDFVDALLALLCCESVDLELAVVLHEFTDSACEPRKLYLLPFFGCFLPNIFFKDSVDADFSLILVLCKLCDR